jgi:hypothetical protein
MGIKFRWGRDFAHRPDQPGAHPASRTMDTGSLPQGKRGLGVALSTRPHLRRGSRKSTAIPLLPLWTFGACYRVKLHNQQHISTVVTMSWTGRTQARSHVLINNTGSLLHLQSCCNTKTVNRWHVSSTGVTIISVVAIMHDSHQQSPVVTPHTKQHRLFQRNEQPGSARRPVHADSRSHNTYISAHVCSVTCWTHCC